MDETDIGDSSLSVALLMHRYSIILLGYYLLWPHAVSSYIAPKTAYVEDRFKNVSSSESLCPHHVLTQSAVLGKKGKVNCSWQLLPRPLCQLAKKLANLNKMLFWLDKVKVNKSW